MNNFNPVLNKIKNYLVERSEDLSTEDHNIHDYHSDLKSRVDGLQKNVDDMKKMRHGDTGHYENELNHHKKHLEDVENHIKNGKKKAVFTYHRNEHRFGTDIHFE